MASEKAYLEYALDQLSGLEDVTYKPMMGEYILYYRGRVFGGIYDNRFLVKRTKSSVALLPDAPAALPYEGAKEMLLADIDDRGLMETLLPAMWEELPERKKK